MPVSLSFPLTTLIVLSPCLALAAEPPPEEGVKTPHELEEVVVVASRVAEPVNQVVGSVSFGDRLSLDRHLVQDIADLVRYEPGVNALGDAGRFGLQGFSIRGLDGNRVAMEIDGVPVAEAFRVGDFAAAGRDLVDLEAIERVEILRGPASTLYGSDALAGVVAYRTRDPEDLLKSVGDDVYVGTRALYSSRDDSTLASAGLAVGGEDHPWQTMVFVSERSGHETANEARAPEHEANPLDYERSSVLAKLVRPDAGWGRWTLAIDHGEGEAQTDIRSMRFGPGRYATTTELLGDDRYTRDRSSLKGEWQHARPWLDQSELLLYSQTTKTRQDTRQTRLADRTTPFPSLRFRRFELEQSADGAKWLGQVRTDSGSIRHWHVFGIEYGRSKYIGLRDGHEVNLDTGAVSTRILGEQFPVRDFPESTVGELGVFWQDEISLGQRLALVPGLRWERYELDSRPDAVFREDYPDVATTDLLLTSWTPKLGLRHELGEHSTLFAQYARGFRAPPFSDVNIGLSLPSLNYEVRPNPDLREETSNGMELGWRWHGPALQASVTLFHNRYRDLIESRANLGVDPDSGALVFQSVNRERARIEGIEAQFEWTPGPDSDWALQGSLAWSQGRDLDRDEPLETVAPGKLVLGANWAPVNANWGLELLGTAVARRSEVAGDSNAFRAPGYALLDAYAWWRLGERVRVNVAARNLADRRYWDWGITRGLAASADNLDFYTATGRSFDVSVAVDW